ncbi:hypothetical protein [Brevibacillus nitrificans]|uniref:hypothetical protein n=1 Tax=Brevibacillus nitrificans TaxID=651560 RepID=UPI00285E3CFC|nr:hypothetical protein [Brevibacillus nitrificans]MDR7319676.1 hypothetical protein [Brevibacillus nitrificans]
MENLKVTFSFRTHRETRTFTHLNEIAESEQREALYEKLSLWNQKMMRVAIQHLLTKQTASEIGNTVQVRFRKEEESQPLIG